MNALLHALLKVRKLFLKLTKKHFLKKNTLNKIFNKKLTNKKNKKNTEE